MNLEPKTVVRSLYEPEDDALAGDGSSRSSIFPNTESARLERPLSLDDNRPDPHWSPVGEDANKTVPKVVITATSPLMH
jgi:hypothetical protein